MSFTIEIIQGDITLIEVDAIVHAANSFLVGGGGVDGALFVCFDAENHRIYQMLLNNNNNNKPPDRR